MELDLRNLPSPYYRVATRAVILDDQEQLLVMENNDGDYEIPGGGWEYDESFEACLRREVQEELGVELEALDPSILGVYKARNNDGRMLMRIVVRASLASYDFKPVDMKRAFWVTKDEFLAMDLVPTAEEGLKEYADKIWSEK